MGVTSDVEEVGGEAIEVVEGEGEGEGEREVRDEPFEPVSTPIILSPRSTSSLSEEPPISSSSPSEACSISKLWKRLFSKLNIDASPRAGVGDGWA